MSGAAAYAAAPGASIHGSAVAWAGRGVLILGAPGSGKSRLVTELLAAGAYLVADDLVRLVPRGVGLEVRPAGATGLIEARAGGIFRIATTSGVPVNLCVELTAAARRERLPERAVVRLAGCDLPLLRVAPAGGAAVGVVLLALWARRVA